MATLKLVVPCGKVVGTGAVVCGSEPGGAPPVRLPSCSSSPQGLGDSRSLSSVVS